MLEARDLMPFSDDCIDLHPEPELPVNPEPTVVELYGPDARLLELLGERLGLNPPSIVRIALVAFASAGSNQAFCRLGGRVPTDP